MNIKIKRILCKYIEILLIVLICILITIVFKNKIASGYVVLIFGLLFLFKDIVLRNKSFVKAIFGLSIVDDKDNRAKIIIVLLRQLFELLFIDTALILIYNKGLGDVIFNTHVIENKENNKNFLFNIIGIIVSIIILISIIYGISFLYMKLDYYDEYIYYEEYKSSYNYKIDNIFKNKLVEYKYYKKIDDKKLNIYNIKFKEDKSIEKEINIFYKKYKTDDYFKVDLNKKYKYYFEEGKNSNLIIVYSIESEKLYVFEYTK